MNLFYDQLMALTGAEELKKVVEKWEILSRNIEQQPFDAPIVLPDLFLYTYSGFGNTKMLNLLAEYLDSKKNLMSFYGDVKFLEFKLDYCHKDSTFTEIYRFIDTIRNAAGFRNEFKGIVRINLNDWLGHHKEKYFIEFLNYLKANTKNWLVILSLSQIKNKEDAKAMESVVSMYLRIESVTLNMATDIEFVEYAGEFLAKYGFVLDESAKKVLADSVAILKKNKYFNGHHTITDMCNDIVYTIFSKSATENRVITAEMLADFTADSEYIKRTIMKSDKLKTMGFI